jgi:beta-ureidopropionase / N-carbamoyl-L-amino-acid hydrolase
MTVSINGEWLFWQRLTDLARIGTTPKGGNCRLTWSALDGQGRDLVVDWLREAGANVLLGVMLAQAE